jgi:hypothetical protein
MILAALAPVAAPAQAHHSLAGYDQSKPMALEGVVAEFRFAHPHPFLIIKVRSANGVAEDWRLEMDNLFELDAIGMSKDSFKAGERVLARGDSSRRKANELYLRRLDRPSDGLRYEQVGFSPRVSFQPKPGAGRSGD